MRAELHSYGALSAEPDLEGCCGQVEAVAHHLELEEFMRKAGGLRMSYWRWCRYFPEKRRNGGVEPDIMCETC